MKQFLCLALSLFLICCLFAGCSKNGKTASTETAAAVPVETLTEGADVSNTQPDEVAGIQYQGIHTKGVTADQLASAIGVNASSVVSTSLDSGEELLIVNDVLYNTISYAQLQCINYGEKTVITLTYHLQDEELDGALHGIITSLQDSYGEPSFSSESTTYTWRDSAVNENYLILYPINETELKLSFYLF